jgi:hypothetical protein
MTIEQEDYRNRNSKSAHSSKPSKANCNTQVLIYHNIIHSLLARLKIRTTPQAILNPPQARATGHPSGLLIELTKTKGRRTPTLHRPTRVQGQRADQVIAPRKDQEQTVRVKPILDRNTTGVTFLPIVCR